MSSRLVGAVVALTAVALLAASIVSSAWWSGHPQIDGRTITAKDVYVGLYGAQGCNTGGDRSCTPLELPGAFKATGYLELGASSLLAILLVLLAVTTFRASERRKQLARRAIAVGGFATVVAIALIVQGPKVKTAQHVSLPMGYGLYLFFIGVAATFAACLLARRPMRSLAPPRIAPRLAAAQLQQLNDMNAMLPPPPAPAPPAPARPASPGGSLPGPAGPLGPGYTPSSRPPPPLPRPLRGKTGSVEPPPPEPDEVLPDDAQTLEVLRISASEIDTASDSAAPRAPTVSTAPPSLPPPVQEPAAGPSPACPQCDAPMSWVEEHLRFFCKRCRMYF
jgi:hypothetical protein